MDSETNGGARKPKVLIVHPGDWLTLGRLPAVLSRGGWQVHAFGNHRSPLMRSRHVSARFPQQWAPPARFVTAFRDHISQHRYEWVILGDDHIIQALRPHANEPWLRPYMPVDVDRCGIDFLASKLGFARLMNRAGLPIPRWGEATTLDEARATAAEIGYPVILKPEFGLAGGGVRKAETPQEIEAAFAASSATGEKLIVQQFVDGRVCLVEALYDGGKPIAWTISWKYRTSPGPFGGSTSRKYFSHPEIESHLERFGNATGTHGFMGFDFLYNPKNGEIHYVEANMRPTSGIIFGPVAGVNFAAALRAMAKRKVTIQRPKTFAPKRGATLPMFPEEPMRICRDRNWSAIAPALFSVNFWRFMPWNEPRLWRPYAGRIYLEWITSRSRRSDQEDLLDQAAGEQTPG